MRRPAVVLIAALCLTSIQPSAQSQTELNELVDRMASYRNFRRFGTSARMAPQP